MIQCTKKYQMQSPKHIIDSVAVYIFERRNLPGQYLFSNTLLKNAYSQILPDENIQKHYNSKILRGRGSGTHGFINSFYCLSDMPETFQ